MPFLFSAMVATVVASNILVMVSINSWLTVGAFSYPLTFLISEIANRSYGTKAARRVVYAGFLTAVIISAFLSTPKIALASGLAFLVAQLFDISIFNRYRKRSWWQAPLAASTSASVLDTIIFFNLAFLGEQVAVGQLALGDLSIKLAMDFILLSPFRWVTSRKQS